jgi:hypothetical protein
MALNFLRRATSYGSRVKPLIPLKIVSGGQTGADRAALDWAINRGIPHGGWCPKGRLAEDGTIPGRYALQETGSKDYLRRTEQNVIDSDGTVILTIKGELTGGPKRTFEFAVIHGRPVLHVCAAAPGAGKVVADFVKSHGVRTLNVAGSRGSGEPAVATFVTRVLDEAFPAPDRAVA